jgi:hypothetical protein
MAFDDLTAKTLAKCSARDLHRAYPLQVEVCKLLTLSSSEDMERLCLMNDEVEPSVQG